MCVYLRVNAQQLVCVYIYIRRVVDYTGRFLCERLYNSNNNNNTAVYIIQSACVRVCVSGMRRAHCSLCHSLSSTLTLCSISLSLSFFFCTSPPLEGSFYGHAHGRVFGGLHSYCHRLKPFYWYKYGPKGSTHHHYYLLLLLLQYTIYI